MKDTDPHWNALRETWTAQPVEISKGWLHKLSRRRLWWRAYLFSLGCALCVGVGYGVELLGADALWQQAGGLLLLAATLIVGSWEMHIIKDASKKLGASSSSMVTSRQRQIATLLRLTALIPTALVGCGAGLLGVSLLRYQADPTAFAGDAVPAWILAVLLGAVSLYWGQRAKRRLLKERAQLDEFQRDASESD